MTSKKWDIYELYSYIARKIPVNLKLKINNNSKIIFSYKKNHDKEIKLNLHKMFLEAPLDVVDSIALLLIKPDEKHYFQQIKIFINENNNKIDYNSSSEGIFAGEIYNLKNIFDEVNRAYFENKLENINIKWGKSSAPTRKRRKHIQFGVYNDARREIRINPILDSQKIHPCFIEFIVYHEMLHSTIPVKFSQNGRRIYHCAEFKVAEKKFKNFKHAEKIGKSFFEIIKQIEKEKSK